MACNFNRFIYLFLLLLWPLNLLNTQAGKKIKVPLSLLVDIGTLLYASVSVFHPDWLIISNFRLRRSENLHKDSHQNSLIYTRVKTGNFYLDECLGSPSHTGYGPATRHNQRSLSWVWSNCIVCVLEYTPLNGFIG